MSRPIQVNVQGWIKYAPNDPPSPPGWWADFKRISRYADCRMFEVIYNGEQVLVGALSRKMTTADPWADVAGKFADMQGMVDFDQFLLGMRKGASIASPMRVRYVIYAKNRYWVMWVKYLLHRRQKGHPGSYETLLGSFDSAVSSRAANLYGRINALYRRLHKSEAERRDRDAVRRDARDELVTQEAQDILDSLDDDGTGFEPHRGAVNI